MKLILASGSERRKELLSWLGIPFEVVVSAFDEKSVDEDNPRELVKRLAWEKAKMVQEKLLNTKYRIPNTLIIGADTVVVVQKEIIGKPKDEQDAVRILTKLSGKTHAVFTGVCVVNVAGGKRSEGVERTEVSFSNLSKKKIADYVKTGEPLDKGGAYAIQMGAKDFVRVVEGSYTNVVGLPLLLLTELLQKQGLQVKLDVGKIILKNTGYRG